MKKVGIVTFHFAINYGAVIQAYALVKGLRDLGVDANIIDYHPDYVVKGGSFKLPNNRKNIRANLVTIYQKLISIYSFFQNDYGLNRKFCSFRNKHLHVTGNVYKSIHDLKSSAPNYDVYVCGSDQIWNPSEQFGVDPAYFLSFGSDQVRRVAYAPSFGKDVLDEIYHHEVGELLNDFDVLSVREKSGVELAHKLSGRDVYWMPDPTILLTDYTPIVHAPGRQKPYMFSYVLRSGEGIMEIQAHIAHKLSLDILVPHNPMRRWKVIGETIYPGPEEWLGYIKYADFVVTNSFHGTVFSILFNKPFITIGLAGKKSGLNARAIGLLKRLGLEHRLLTDLSIENANKLLYENIDWGEVNHKISEWRGEALEFIDKEIIKY
ncbi:MAG: polysaccharide pyruvyl transferase family protein [Methylomonas sp.]|jgi:hypothetical protein|uniref:polysaccharide pyruvyl transferase family protein n=1 Tax=Methylomonas sp. TaxID=418 RepID=UPI0025D93776|nr:polysaccharide pyruvyl transferase family protein [Methylomonas sp.]MCK9609083.1 polysaccharide pyruvyl transferase family protein [Methylomonas sp.]